MKTLLVKASGNRLTGSAVGSSNAYTLVNAVSSYSGLYAAPDASPTARYVKVNSTNPTSPSGLHVGSSNNAGAFCSASFYSKFAGIGAHLSTIGGGRIGDLLLSVDGRAFCRVFSGQSVNVEADYVRGFYRVGVAVSSVQMTALIFPTSSTNVNSLSCSSGGQMFLFGFQTAPSSYALLPYRQDLSSATPDFVPLNVTGYARGDEERAFKMRSSTGRGFVEKTGFTKSLRLTADYLSRDDRASISSWWSNQAALSLHFADETTMATSGAGIVTFSGRISNAEHPVSRTIRPYLDQFGATIILEQF